jgi:pSer/pThr/pTyr-binding forkhead associated (FHA) protein/tetratricopeptide (TPR) repeat protein
MTAGRRAADRRRERDGGGHDDDNDPGTTPGAVPHSDYVEVDDDSGVRHAPLLSADHSAEEDLPEASAEELVERSASGPATRRSPSPTPGRVAPARGPVVDEEPLDADRSFARELQRRPRPNETRAIARPEPTQVKELKPLKRPRPGGVLVVVASEGDPPVGTTLPITVFPALLGRTSSADLHLSDKAVSLRHAELDWDPATSTFFITDLGSTSGTLRNGAPIDGRVALDHGDVIAVGRTELRFKKAETAPVAKPPPTPAPVPDVVLEHTERLPERTTPGQKAAREAERRAREQEALARRLRVRRRAIMVIAAALCLLGVVIAVRVVGETMFGDTAPAQIRHQVAILLGEARKHLQEGDVDGAAARVQTVLGLHPKNEEATSLERVVLTEKSARDALQLALRLGDEDRDDEALAALQRIADTSVFAKDRDRLRQSLASRALVRSLRIVENLLEQGRIDEALARARAHVERFPDDPGGKALLERVLAAQAGAPRDPALQPARAAFAEGRLDDARAIARKAGYVGFVGDIDRFARALDEGKAALARFDGAAARGPLDEAFRLLGSLGASATSPVFATVQKPYADALYLTGTEKLEAGDRCGAARDLYKAARVLPGDARLQAEGQKLQALADQGLQKARGAKSQDAARAAAIAREHLCLAPSGSALYEELAALAR